MFDYRCSAGKGLKNLSYNCGGMGEKGMNGLDLGERSRSEQEGRKEKQEGDQETEDAQVFI